MQKHSFLDIIDKLMKAGNTILPLDKSEYLESLLKCNIYIYIHKQNFGLDSISYDEIKEGSMDEIFAKISKWLRLKKTENRKSPNLIFSAIRELSPSTESIKEGFFIVN